MGTSVLNGRAAARAALAAVVAVAILAAYLNREALDAAGLDLWLRQAGAWGPALYMGVYVLATVHFLPGAVLTLAGGALFGPIWGTFYSLGGATIGATAAFAIARYVAADWVARRAGPRARRLIDGVEKEGWRFVAFVRLVPLLPFNLLNYALGLTRIRLVHYALASYIFMLPGALAYSYLGYAGREALAGGEGLVRKGLIALALLGAIAFLPRLLGRLRGTSPPDQISAAELKRRLDTREDITVLDVRAAKDYAGKLGHIDASLNIPLDQLPQRLAELDYVRDRPIAVICRTNRMSGQAVELLRRSGFRRVHLVANGMLGWNQHHDA
jgi:uncharacterized membrane protein YdjX (TVP38/TMEM64 family)/rhodanese-related sulfurtransferase